MSSDNQTTLRDGHPVVMKGNVNPNLMKMLEKLWEDVATGEITSLAFVAVKNDNQCIPGTFISSQPAALLAIGGLEYVKHNILSELTHR